MNWMTSAKNRFQRSKNKRSDNLRLIASSKLPAFQQSGHSNGYGQRKSSVIVHNSSVNEQRKDKISLPMHNTTQSSDVFMLNNLSRARVLNSANQKINVPRGVSSGVNPQPDPLSQLEVSPAKSLRKDSDSLLEFEGQSIQYFNNGELCDELGRLLISFPPQQPPLAQPPSLQPQRQRQQHHPQMSFGDHRSSPGAKLHVSGTGDNLRAVPQQSASPDRFQSATASADDSWWQRTLGMLEDANLDPGTLQVVLRELGGGGGGFRSNSTSTVMKDLTPPSPREALNGLYSALSKVGQDPKAALVVFDVIRMLELVDKQTKRPFGTTVATASATANTVTTATTASSAYQHAAERSAHRERMPVPVPKAAEGPAGSVREGNEEVELCLGDIMATESVKQESVGGGPRGLAGIRTGAARPNEHTAKSSTTNNGLATATNRKNERLPNSSFWSDFITEHQHQHQSKPTNNFTAPNSRTPPPHAPRAAAPRTIPASTTTGAAPAKAPTQAAAQARVSATAGVVGVKRKAAEKEKEDEELRLEDFF